MFNPNSAEKVWVPVQVAFIVQQDSDEVELVIVNFPSTKPGPLVPVGIREQIFMQVWES